MYKNRTQGWLKHLDFILFDLVALHLAYVITYLIVSKGQNPYTFHNVNNICVMSLIGLVSIFIAESYKNVLKHSIKKDLFISLRQAFLVCVFSLLYVILLTREINNGLVMIVITNSVYFVIGFIVKELYKKFVSSKHNPKEKRSLIIITSEQNAQRTVHEMLTHNYAQYTILGICILDKKTELEEIQGVKVLASGEDMFEYICRNWVDEILIDAPQTEYENEIVNKLTIMGIVVHINYGVNYMQFGKKQVTEKIGKFVCVTCAMNYASPIKLAIKRCVDIFCGLIGTFITFILIIFIGPLILIKSPGPLFFKQERVGKNGKKFYMYKFRSMYLDAEERKKELMEKNRVKDGLMFKLDEDPRIIGSGFTKDGKYKKGIGNFIRQTSLDEFPQFINILKGDMSLIGTRPPTLDEWEKYNLHHRARLAAKPGLTGMWQVSGRSDITDFEEIVKLDTQYISDWSLLLDLKIIFKTFIAVIFHKGSM